MLKAHFDDSWNDDVFVVAGFVATAENWASFSDEWRLALSAPRGVRKLVANEAMKLRGQFYGFSSEERDDKLKSLSGIVEAHVALELFSIIPVKSFKDEFKKVDLPKIAGDPYYPAMMTVIRRLASQQVTLGYIEKINFIFDEKKKQEGRIYSAWAGIADHQLPEMRQIISKTPTFESDDDVLPLQAADWAAWHRREQGILGTTFNALDRPWNVPVMDIIFTPELIRQTFGEIAEGYRKIQRSGRSR